MITCSKCNNGKPLGTQGNGPAYAMERTWVCELHFTRFATEERKEKLHQAEMELKHHKKRVRNAASNPDIGLDLIAKERREKKRDIAGG